MIIRDILFLTLISIIRYLYLFIIRKYILNSRISEISVIRIRFIIRRFILKLSSSLRSIIFSIKSDFRYIELLILMISLLGNWIDRYLII